MTRPEIIRADSIDLQDADAPSAKDHTRTEASESSSASLGAHQAETLREVAQETAAENSRSPRISWTNGNPDHQSYDADDLVASVTNKLAETSAAKTMQAQQHPSASQDSLAVAQNGGLSTDESDADGDTDESMDDDMMDKISSSPSIEDGRCTSLPPLWPRRVDSLPPDQEPGVPCSPATLDEPRSSSPYLEIATYMPIHVSRNQSKTFTGPSPTEPFPTAPSPDLKPTDAQYDCAELGPYSHDEYDDHAYDFEHEIFFDELDDAHHPEAHGDMLALDAMGAHSPPLLVRPLDIRKAVKSVRCAACKESNNVSAFNRATCETSDDAPAMIPYEATEDDDDDDFPFPSDPRYIDAGWNPESLHDTEDIDFDFVYALHTFVATVEGQANATKGDTMVLLDDSNSYWWLVRVAKDNSIGYLPAEHIETPTERLARLNKHRNIDLSATMLGDQAGKESKSTFRSALRGKKKKTVVFAEPTYVDYSDFADFSSDEEDAEELLNTQQDGARQEQKAKATEQAQKAASDESIDETAKVEPLKPRAPKEVKLAEPVIKEVIDEDETRRSSEQFFEAKPEGPSRSRNGTVRNTDSFFKDETVETKKITLTPNLLRDDTAPRSSNDSKELKQRASLDKMEKLERELQPDKKDDKKKKEKKPSAIRSFFSRKDKKKASNDDDDDSLGKRSMDTVNEDHDDESVQDSPQRGGPQRHPSKLQKPQPRGEPSPTRKPGSAPQKSSTRELAEYIASEGRTNDVSNVPPASASMRIVQEQDAAETSLASSMSSASRDRSPELARSASQQKEERSGLAKIKLSRSGSNDKGNKVEKPQKVTKAKARVELDDFDSPDEESVSSPVEASQQHQLQQQQAQEAKTEDKQLRPTLPGAFPDSYLSTQTTSSAQSDKTITPGDVSTAAKPSDRLSESPVEVSPVGASNPPALMVDTSSGHSSDSPSPELIEADETTRRHAAQDSMTTSSSSAGGSQTSNSWNDAKLRAFFDSSSDIRDMLVVVYDKSDVVPAGPEHPVVGPLFREQNAKLAEITTQLDNMLGDWLARKQRMRGTV
ncbi:hypothetical protein D7B24_007893 [Verticillium nonalfalfae]|uniref:SH3 domain-containing protein n=1 Tax=Verticillium nonalfalfae TaxID=1051616 RepID=A0A3M9Y602_9PEZI|nr:uncharacterized protein D7B24_007893 [Verticillium nonalfalfae]RNJ55897.1 hypothetical protein D7B24_007893 [Verticillium nonalfalfae]